MDVWEVPDHDPEGLVGDPEGLLGIWETLAEEFVGCDETMTEGPAEEAVAGRLAGPFAAG